jgi:hypothetical protein
MSESQITAKIAAIAISAPAALRLGVRSENQPETSCERAPASPNTERPSAAQ